MLLVSGGNGNLARSVIANLLRMTDPGNILVTTRDPASAHAQELAARGVSLRHADFDAPETLGPAFAGASRALLISTYDDNSVRLRQNLAALEAAKAAGVRHILYTSFLLPDRTRSPNTASASTGRPNRQSPPPASATRSCATRSMRRSWSAISTKPWRRACCAAAAGMQRAPMSRATILVSPPRRCSRTIGRRTAFSTRQWSAPTPATR